ncbi:MAG: flavin reductase family protein [Brevinema sp.]
MFKPIAVGELRQNPFSMPFNWALLGASHQNETNAMTISWGFTGYIWEKHTVMAFVRPQRHTQHIIHGAETFSLSFFDESFKAKLGYMGSKSGKDEDKIAQSGLKMSLQQGAPVFEEANLVIICKKLYTGRIEESGFIDPSISSDIYPQKDFHHIYIGEQVTILQQ